MIQNDLLMNQTFRLVFPLLLLATLSSCISNKQIVNFQESSFSTDSLTTIVNVQAEYRLRAHDVLSIKVRGLNLIHIIS